VRSRLDRLPANLYRSYLRRNCSIGRWKTPNSNPAPIPAVHAALRHNGWRAACCKAAIVIVTRHVPAQRYASQRLPSPPPFTMFTAPFCRYPVVTLVHLAISRYLVASAFRFIFHLSSRGITCNNTSPVPTTAEQRAFAPWTTTHTFISSTSNLL